MLAVIGGTGFAELAGLTDVTEEVADTPWGPALVEMGLLHGVPALFIARHGKPPTTPPHQINYRANIHALAASGVSRIIAVNAVGTVNPALLVPQLVVPDQLIDYTWGRAQTFHDTAIRHIDFTYPYDQALRADLLAAIELAAERTPQLTHIDSGVYGCTQGPRLETAAEVRRLQRDGCDIVGMTAMPEAALARERNIPYAGLSVTINKGAGIDGEVVNLADIGGALATGMGWVREVLRCYLMSATSSPDASTSGS